MRKSLAASATTEQAAATQRGGAGELIVHVDETRVTGRGILCTVKASAIAILFPVFIALWCPDAAASDAGSPTTT